MRQILPESRPPTGSSVPNVAEGATAEKPVITVKPAGKQIGLTPPTAAEKPPILRQKQDGHIAETPQNRNRLRQGTSTSTFDGDAVEDDALTQEPWNKGTPQPKRPNVREYDFGRRIGKGPNGGGRSVVRVHRNAAGEIHGHPSGPELP